MSGAHPEKKTSFSLFPGVSAVLELQSAIFKKSFIITLINIEDYYLGFHSSLLAFKHY
jgi:hypothetical protein